MSLCDLLLSGIDITASNASHGCGCTISDWLKGVMLSGLIIYRVLIIQHHITVQGQLWHGGHNSYRFNGMVWYVWPASFGYWISDILEAILGGKSVNTTHSIQVSILSAVYLHCWPCKGVNTTRYIKPEATVYSYNLLHLAFGIRRTKATLFWRHILNVQH